jgi:hypothetical protein
VLGEPAADAPAKPGDVELLQHEVGVRWHTGRVGARPGRLEPA